MKKFIIIPFIILFISVKLYSQISLRKVNSKDISQTTKKYDSLKNFVGENVNEYIGQDLYLKPLSKSRQSYGYEDFFNNYEVILNKTYSTESERQLALYYAQKDNIYKCCGEGNIYSKYEALANKYFTVLSVIKDPKAEQDELLYGDKYYLKLQDKDSKEILYFKYSSRFDFSFPFVVVGYYLKLKNLKIGTKYVVRGKNWIDDDVMRDVNTGKPVSDFIAGKIWKCTDVIIEDRFNTISLVLQNEKKEEITIDDRRIDDKRDILSFEEAEKYKKKFGLELYLLILNGKVKIGMTKEMAVLAWGKPKDINETILKNLKSEQWVYNNGNYIYFTNGVLSGIQ
jgi:hypothetical protein